MLSIIMLNIVMFNVVLLNSSFLIHCYNQCHCAECHYAECHYAECPGAFYMSFDAFERVMQIQTVGTIIVNVQEMTSSKSHRTPAFHSR